MVITRLPAQRAALTEERRDWWRSAACRDADPELFFPVTAHGPGAAEVARAKEVCAACLVRRQCLQYALATHQMHGVWGGTTEDERRLDARREREPDAERPPAAARVHGGERAKHHDRRGPARPVRPEPGGNGGRVRGARIRSA